MAAPIAHLLVAQTYTESLGMTLDRGFALGSMFPDIRRLADLRRSETHNREATFKGLVDLKSFDAGADLHNILDVAREDYAKQNGYYEDIGANDILSATAIKFYEDILLYDKLEKKTANFFDGDVSLEVGKGIDTVVARDWHSLIKEYLESPPTKASIKLVLSVMKFSADHIDQLFNHLDKCAESEVIRRGIETFYNDSLSYLRQI